MTLPRDEIQVESLGLLPLTLLLDERVLRVRLSLPYCDRITPFNIHTTKCFGKNLWEASTCRVVL